MKVECKHCGKRRGILPEVGVLICPRCDYADGDAGPWIEHRVKDVRSGEEMGGG